MTVPFPVVPADPNNADIVRTNSQKVKAKVTLLMRKQLHYWAVLHISYRGGRYSIERLLSLDAYTRTTPVARVVFVCLAAPGSLALFILALESVPLQDPAAGWAGNYGYWVRVAIAAMVVANGFFVQVKIFVKGCRIQPWQLLLMVVGAAVLETPVAIAVSALTWFPVPFSIITMAPSFYPVLLFVFYGVVGREVIREMLKHIDQVIQYLKFTAALQLMAVIYPMYQVLFLAVNDTHYELPVMLLLPVLKLTIKNVILRCVTHMEDMMPEAVIFTADLFNALYMATSMESATSKITVVIIVMIDIVQSAIVLYCLKDRTNSTLARLAQVTGVTIDVIVAASQICRSSEIFKKQNRQRLRIRSCLPHKLSTNDRDLLERLERISTLDSLRRHTSPARTDTITVDTRVVFESRQQLSKALTWADRREPTVRIPAGTIITTKQPNCVLRFISQADFSEFANKRLLPFSIRPGDTTRTDSSEVDVVVPHDDGLSSFTFFVFPPPQ
ncbi:unnamed protein product [Phytophthora lilii]|uniref:Unnamed protein product n=1 Tax=Phytophthora lilii TaxID=2077276 RepID=A0A9W6U0A3_9STRA|nr:unnamed protein product [Phytophthora lilii]